MSCRKFRELVIAVRPDDRTHADRECIAVHELECADCRRLLTEATALEAALEAAREVTPAPEGFEARVMARLPLRKKPARSRWLEALFGVLRAPAPLFTLGQAAAVTVLLLMVFSAGMWVGHTRGGAPGPSLHAGIVVQADGKAQVTMDKEFVDELVARHQAASSMPPLSDGDGMRLVSY